MSDKGSIVLRLNELLEKSGLSKNRFCQRAEIQRSQLNGYLNNSITRFDADALIRICHALDCPILSALNGTLSKHERNFLSLMMECYDTPLPSGRNGICHALMKHP